MSKNHTEFKNRQAATQNKIYKRVCLVCNVEYLMAKNQKYCSPQCKGKVKYIDGSSSTENQYNRISGNWRRYLHRLLYSGGRKRDGLTVDLLLHIAKEQNYKCALSGADLTCNLSKGKISLTNASIDRINAGKQYNPGNIQLVCRAVNSWRSNLPITEFVNWCQKIVTHTGNRIGHNL